MKRKRINIELPEKDFKILEKLAKVSDHSLVGMIAESLRYYHLHNPADIQIGKKLRFQVKPFKSNDRKMSEMVDQTLYG